MPRYTIICEAIEERGCCSRLLVRESNLCFSSGFLAPRLCGCRLKFFERPVEHTNFLLREFTAHRSSR
jgi:hypothetical protein